VPRDFLLYPAIDLVDGRAVRLLQGNFDALLTNEQDDALERARMTWEAGAGALHVIDLDAARTGAPADPNASLVAELAARRPTGTLLQVGGGLRTAAAVEQLLEVGVDRVLIGTMAMREPDVLTQLVERHGERIAVALDSRDGTIRVSGWVEDAGVPVAQAACDLASAGVRTFLVTGIERDGSLGGPDLHLLEAVLRAVPHDIAVIAAGGVTTPADVQATRSIGCAGAVVGRALLDDPSALAGLLRASR